MRRSRAVGAITILIPHITIYWGVTMAYSSDLLHLTAREEEVLRLVARGRSARAVASELNIAPCTVERHIENVRLKTRTRNRAHMIAVVMRDGWLTSLPVV
ncbi:helix-turn-helix transcriptional regulator [Sphingomonas aurantiaca]